MSTFWSGAVSNVAFMLLGAAVSFYATIVFERYKRFGDLLREIAQARLHTEGYPISPRDIVRAHQMALDYWRFLEGMQWSLDAEGHHGAAAQVGRLVSFAYRTTACLERMLGDQAKGSSIDTYLSAFQSDISVRSSRSLAVSRTKNSYDSRRSFTPARGHCVDRFPRQSCPRRGRQ
jgi:hypothetical protein